MILSGFQVTQHTYFFLILAIKSLIYGVAVAIAIAVVGTKSSLLKKKHTYIHAVTNALFFKTPPHPVGDDMCDFCTSSVTTLQTFVPDNVTWVSYNTN